MGFTNLLVLLRSCVTNINIQFTAGICIVDGQTEQMEENSDDSFDNISLDSWSSLEVGLFIVLF